MVDAQNGPGVDELLLARARIEGELAAVSSQLAASVAAEEQLRIEAAEARSQAAVAEAALAHAQQLAAARDAAAQRRIGDLEEQLADARRLQTRAKEERSAVIGALGRRARKAIGQTEG